MGWLVLAKVGANSPAPWTAVAKGSPQSGRAEATWSGLPVDSATLESVTEGRSTGTGSLFCHACADARQLLVPLVGDPLATPYQRGKHGKHTQVSSSYPLQSVFTDASSSAYGSYMINALAAGSVHVDQHVRVSVLWCAGRPIGYRIEHGKVAAPTDTVQVVLTSLPDMTHAWTEQSSPVMATPCDGCGGPALRA